MTLKLHTVSRDNLFDAKAIYNDGNVTVKKGSRINTNYSMAFKPSTLVRNMLADKCIVNNEGIILKDVTFNSLSTAATFVTGRVSNGMITWKTPDGKYVRETLRGIK